MAVHVMLRTVFGGRNGVLQREVSSRPQILRLQSFSAPISTNTAINKSLRRSQYEGTRPERGPSSRGGAYERNSERLGNSRVGRIPRRAGPYESVADRAEHPRSRKPPGRVAPYERASDRPEYPRNRIRRPDHQQGQDGEDLAEAQRIHERYQELKQDQRIPRSITKRTKKVDKRAVVNELSQKSQYDYTSVPGGNRALRRDAKFGKNLEKLEPSAVSPLAAGAAIDRKPSFRERRHSSQPDRASRTTRRTIAFEQDDEGVDGMSIPGDLIRDDGRFSPEPRQRSFTMGRQDVRSDRTPFPSRERDSGYGPSASSDTGDFGRYGRNSSRDHGHAQADNRSKVPLSIPYTTPASEFLYGTSVVTAALLSSRRKLYKLYIYGGDNREAHDQDNRIRHLALESSVVVERVKGDWLHLMDKMSLGRPHNGYILEASPLPKLPITGLQRVSKPQGPLHVVIDYQSREDEEINGRDTNVKYDVGYPRYPIILLLDGILDPGNLGAILRTAFFLGVDAVAIANRSSAPLSSVALKASAGATESLPLMSVSQPGSFIDSCQNHGWKVYAAAAPNPRQRSGYGKYFSTSGLGSPVRDHPCLLILGGEGEGLRWNIQQKADFEVGIDGQRIGKGGIDSLNVSVAAGLLCEAFLRKPVGLTNAHADASLEVDTSNNEVSHNADIKVEDRLF